MTTGGGTIRITTGALALTLALAPAMLRAQAVNDYRLPGTVTTTEPTRPAPGPVDSDAPAVRTPAPRPSTAATPAATSPAATPSASTAPVAQRRAARREATVQPAPTLLPTPQPAVTPSAAAALPLPTVPPSVPPVPLPTPVLAEPAAPSTEGTWLWPWGAALLALLAAGACYVLWRRRAARPLALSFEPPVVTPPAPQPDPVPAPVAAPPLPAPPPPPAVPDGLTMTLEARRMNASLMATTLNYTLRLTNHGSATLSALAVEGDMIAAHGSIPPEQQIAQDGQRLELRHALVELAPGESAEFTGDLRLPLTAVTPIRAGTAAYFVPLARFRVEAGQADGTLQVLVQTYVVGETSENPGAGLRPFRLDLGPRTYSRISQRAVA